MTAPRSHAIVQASATENKSSRPVKVAVVDLLLLRGFRRPAHEGE